MLVTLKGLSVTKKLSKLYLNSPVWLTGPFTIVKIIKTGQFNYNIAIPAMLVTLKGLSVP